MTLNHIRNFSIIAHIDHGKSTLADRFIQLCGGLSKRKMSEQVLDSMDIERERGITIKAQSVALSYRADDGRDYVLNLIDTPGHVDFSYEVSRSLSACEGALLVVDAAQGVEAQSIANCYNAIEQGLEVLPVLNKIDLAAADPERVKHEIEDIIGIDASAALAVSAKTGEGVEELLRELVLRVPPPQGDPDSSLKALIVDSWFDSYVGVVSLVRVIDGSLRRKARVLFMATGEVHQIETLGVFTPERVQRDHLETGEVGFVTAGIKNLHAARVGDTLTAAAHPAVTALPGFEQVKPRVFAGIFPASADDHKALRDALDKLSLNDASLTYEPETSIALGIGFRCGFLGMLHMEIVQERLEREYQLEIIVTAPTVTYKVVNKNGSTMEVHNPAQLPPPGEIDKILEPIARVSVLTPPDYVGNVIGLCIEKRGVQKKLQYTGKQAAVEFEIPLGEIIVDFFDRLKSVTRGYASFDYQPVGYQAALLDKLDLLINGDRVDALSVIVHRQNAQAFGRVLVEKMQELIPRQMFDVAVQAALGSRIIARATVKALRKNVTAKCYGGDVTRKKKLIEKQKAGKKRMKQIGKVEVPQKAFLAVLTIRR